MPLSDLWIATLTSTRSDSGSDSDMVGIINQNGIDIIHENLGFGRTTTGGGKLYHLEQIAEAGFEPDQNYYMRMGIRGDDAWRPDLIAAWGERDGTGNVVPLAYDSELDIVLSTDSSEGRISLPVRQIIGG